MNKRQGSYEVPFFLTGSQFHDHQTINAYRSGRDFLSLVAAWMKISSPKLPSGTCPWLNDEVCKNQESVFRYSGELIDYHELPALTLESFIKEKP